MDTKNKSLLQQLVDEVKLQGVKEFVKQVNALAINDIEMTPNGLSIRSGAHGRAMDTVFKHLEGNVAKGAQ